MKQNVVAVMFEVESEAYQALSELKTSGSAVSFVSQAALVKKENGVIKMIDGFNVDPKAGDSTAKGGLIGACIGLLGGPFGVLLGGAIGMMVGSTRGAEDAIDKASLIEQIAGKMEDGDLALIGLAGEEEEKFLDEKLAKFKTWTIRYDAAVVAQEVEEARATQAELYRQARESLKKEKNEEYKKKVEAKREKLEKELNSLKPRV